MNLATSQSLSFAASSRRMCVRAPVCVGAAHFQDFSNFWALDAGHEMTLSKREFLQKWYGFDCMCNHCKAYLERYNLPASGDGGAFFH